MCYKEVFTGTFFFWMLGFSLMHASGSGFVGNAHIFSYSFYADSNISKECFLAFQTMFCATAATIVSGAMAERTKFSAYIIISIVISLLVYPVEGHWAWGGGWLAGLGFHDFAGSAVVHACGGAVALAGAIVLGPRIGK